MKMNRNYKDSVFVKLFSDKKEILNLYNAIRDTNYKEDETEVKIITLEDVLFMERNNDLCFTIDDKLVVLIEHQSSINQNMPLRFLLYIAREYEKIIDSENVYKSKLIKIPKPEFIVLYNGKDKYPSQSKLYLSDAFPDKLNLKLELEVDVININYEEHNNVIEKSSVLNGYSYFIYLVREYMKENKDIIDSKELLEYCIKKAIRQCISENILKEFLERNGSEVVNMLYTEFKLEDAKVVWRQEGFEDGIEEGIEIGITKGMIKQINALKRLNINENQILDIIKQDYNISEEEIRKYL